MSFFLAFLSSICWGAADYLGGIHAKRIDMVVLTMVREIAGMTLLFVLAVIVGGSPLWSDIALGLGVGVLAGVALPIFFGALAAGRMALVAPVAGSVGAIIPIVIGIVGGERPSPWQLGGLVLAVGAIAFVSIEHIEHEGGRRRHVDVGEIAKATLCGVVFGVFYAGMHHTSDDSGLWPAFSVCVGILVTLFSWTWARNRPLLRQVRPAAVRQYGLGGVLDAIAATLFLFATRSGLLSITAGVASLYPVGTALLATFLLKEHLTRVNAIGLVLCGASLAFIAA
jgi:drug/metabolite transporter (DMT)-like permease